MIKVLLAQDGNCVLRSSYWIHKLHVVCNGMWNVFELVLFHLFEAERRSKRQVAHDIEN